MEQVLLARLLLMLLLELLLMLLMLMLMLQRAEYPRARQGRVSRVAAGGGS